jgi:hypothetical protein
LNIILNLYSFAQMIMLVKYYVFKYHICIEMCINNANFP